MSAANDVWSLGVILVNLTCGRNPWKRASVEDSTFQAYLKDPFFLKTILPLSSEMVSILSRVFELDPIKRISIPELRQLILECPRFTENPMVQTPWVPEQIDYIPHAIVYGPHGTPVCPDLWLVVGLCAILGFLPVCCFGRFGYHRGLLGFRYHVACSLPAGPRLQAGLPFCLRGALLSRGSLCLWPHSPQPTGLRDSRLIAPCLAAA
jgi:hypothetical protein